VPFEELETGGETDLVAPVQSSVQSAGNPGLYLHQAQHANSTHSTHSTHPTGRLGKEKAADSWARVFGLNTPVIFFSWSPLHFSFLVLSSFS
jgi:hypothetical protein